MNVVTGVVVGWMSIPAMIELAGDVFFVVVKREIPVFEPDHFEASGANSFRIESLVEHAPQTLWGKFGLVNDSVETITGYEPLSNGVESVEIAR